MEHMSNGCKGKDTDRYWASLQHLGIYAELTVTCATSLCYELVNKPKRAGRDMARKVDLDGLLLRVAKGDRKAFAALYGATSSQVFGAFETGFGGQDDPEIAMIDAYELIWSEALGYGQSGLSPEAWILNQARKVMTHRLSRRSGADVVGLFDDAEAKDQSSALAAALARLPGEQAEAIQRAYINGDDYSALSKRFGIPLEQIRPWMGKALLSLREGLA